MSIIISGDFAPRRNLPPYDPFTQKIKDIFCNSYTIVNLETPLTEKGFPILKAGKNFRCGPKYAEILKNAGVDCVTLANNHIRDYGEVGVIDTINYCNNAGLDVVGAGENIEEARKPIIIDRDNKDIAIFNYCEKEFSIATHNGSGANPFDVVNAYYDINNYKKKVDRIIIIYHGGIEYQHYPTIEMVKNFHFLIDAGADVIIAHHTHIYSGYEIYKGKLIYYGLGNLFAYSKNNKINSKWYKGILAEIDIKLIDRISYFITKYNGKSLNIDIMEHNEIVEDRKLIEDISKNVLDINYFFSMWEKEYCKQTHSILRALQSSSNIQQKIFKLFPFLIPKLTSYRLINWLDILQCDSLRNKAIKVLENLYQKRED